MVCVHTHKITSNLSVITGHQGRDGRIHEFPNKLGQDKHANVTLYEQNCPSECRGVRLCVRLWLRTTPEVDL